MNILITGVRSFFGGNLAATLAEFRNERDFVHKISRRELPAELKIRVWDSDLPWEELDQSCRKADFVFHFAGTDESGNPDEFMSGNFGLSIKLLDKLRRYENTCPVMLASSVRAAAADMRKGDGSGRHLEYGRSKLAAEELFFEHGEKTGAKILIYRFPDFSDERRGNAKEMFAEALTGEMLAALIGREHRCEFCGGRMEARRNGRYCFVPLPELFLGQVAEERDNWHKAVGKNKV